MATLSKERIAQLKEADKKSSYIKREWKTNEADNLSLKEWAELINPIYKHVDLEASATIICKEKKNGDTFLKMEIPLKGGTVIEYELSYENDFEEGDEVDPATLQFCEETWLDNSHAYVTGEII